MLESVLNKVVHFSLITLLKKRLRDRCFRVNFVIFFKEIRFLEQLQATAFLPFSTARSSHSQASYRRTALTKNSKHSLNNTLAVVSFLRLLSFFIMHCFIGLFGSLFLNRHKQILHHMAFFHSNPIPYIHTESSLNYTVSNLFQKY